MYSYDNRIVVTLDAGGTNFVFGAMRANEFIVDPITVPSNAHDLDLCLRTMVDGFRKIIDRLDEQPVASRSTAARRIISDRRGRMEDEGICRRVETRGTVANYNLHKSEAYVINWKRC